MSGTGGVRRGGNEKPASTLLSMRACSASGGSLRAVMPKLDPRPEKTSGHLLLPLTRQELLVIPAEVEHRPIRLHFDDPVRQPAHEFAVVRHETTFMFLINHLESMNGNNHPAWDKMAGQNPP